MPKCKNDPSRTYKGDEPSPKGLGYCAHASKLKEIRKGKDGENWVVNRNQNGVKRWVKIEGYSLGKLEKYLFDKFKKWWKFLANTGLLVIYKNGGHKFVKANEKKHIELGLDQTVKQIIWSPRSTDSLYFFINYILHKCSIDTIEQLITSKNEVLLMVSSFGKFFKKEYLSSSKDYTLKYHNKSSKSLAKKLARSKVIKKRM